MKFYIDSMPL